MVAPTGEQFTIAAGGYEAVLVEGGGIRTLTHEGRDVLAGYPLEERPVGGRGQVLVPWVNRVRDGAWHFEGRDLQLAVSEPATRTAIHGLVRWCAWQPQEVTADCVRLGCRLMAQTGYPWSLDVAVEYAVGPGGLAVTMAATNLADSPAPFAAGMHPYLAVAGHLVDDVVLTVPAETRQLVDERLLPAGTAPVSWDHDFRAGRLIGSLQLDDAFTDLTRGEDGRAVVRAATEDAAVELWLDEAFRWVQVFTGDTLERGARESLAVEPMTSPADAFNSGTDLVVIEPGRTWSGSFGIRLG
jgi:aldose 1-epimerase